MEAKAGEGTGGAQEETAPRVESGAGHAERDGFRGVWSAFARKHPSGAEFLAFFVVCNAVTLLQLVMMPVFKLLLGLTPLIDTTFRALPVGHDLDGSTYYVFDYASGSISNGGGGGLAYFLAVQLALGIAQIVNFFTQRSVTFKGSGSVRRAAFWYFFAYVLITLGAAALQGLYKAPLYRLLIDALGSGTGTTAADVLVMLINATISFWVFFPIMKFIFKQK